MSSILLVSAEHEDAYEFHSDRDEFAYTRSIDAIFGPQEKIGLIAPTCIEAIYFWKALLLTGRKPIFLHYPTKKLSRIHWKSEIEHAVSNMGIEGIAYFGEIANPELPISSIDISLLATGKTIFFNSPFSGQAIQLSSGTTGFRKGVPLDIAEVTTHVADFNQILQLGQDDCVVSWLPLYHDMGFIANFIMPLLLDIPLVLMDPITWVRQPDLLFQAIEKHRGTLCFMPNFAFDVMARTAAADRFDLSSLRRWISCSEPTRLAHDEPLYRGDEDRSRPTGQLLCHGGKHFCRDLSRRTALSRHWREGSRQLRHPHSGS